MRLLSVVVPLKDERDNVRPLVERVRDALRDCRRVGTRLRGRRQHRRHVRGAGSGRGRRSARQGRAAAPQLRPDRRDPGRPRRRRAATSSSRWTATCRTTRPTSRCCWRSWTRATTPCSASAMNRQDKFLLRKVPSLVRELADPQGDRRAVQGHRLHAAGDAPRPGRRPAALRRDAPLHPGARHPAGREGGAGAGAATTRARPARRSTT